MKIEAKNISFYVPTLPQDASITIHQVDPGVEQGEPARGLIVAQTTDASQYAELHAWGLKAQSSLASRYPENPWGVNADLATKGIAKVGFDYDGFVARTRKTKAQAETEETEES